MVRVSQSLTGRSIAGLMMRRLATGLVAMSAMVMGPGVGAQTAPAPGGALPAVSANLNINPKRITFDRLGKAAAVYVFNQGGAGGAFEVQMIDRIMLPNGQIVPLAEATTKPEEKPVADKLKSAHEMVVTTPRRLNLSGNSGQTIRIRAGSAADVPPGEYRTHLTVTAIPPADIGLTAEQAASQKEGQLSFRVNSVLGISIPVIIRVGPVDVRAAIEGAKIAFELVSSDGKSAPVRTAVLTFDLVRQGPNSLFGDVEVRGAKEKGDKDPMGAVRGVGVYPEIDKRAIKLALNRIPVSGEQIEIAFRDDDTMPGKQLSRVILTAP